MDEREELKRWIATVVQNAANEDSKLVKADINLLLSASAQLVGILSSRYETLAKKYRPNRPKPPKLAPAKPVQQDSSRKSSADSSKPQIDAQAAKNRPDRMSRIQTGIQQGVQKAQQAPKSPQQALLGKIYGPQNKEVAFTKAAKALAS